MAPRHPPRTPHDRRLIAVIGRCDPTTVARAYRGQTTDLATLRVAEAAERLGYEPPPPPRDA